MYIYTYIVPRIILTLLITSENNVCLNTLTVEVFKIPCLI